MPAGFLKSIDIGINLGFLSLGSSWDVNEPQRDAAWEMYVELITRVTGNELTSNAILREALTSIYSLFESTRGILRKYGPVIAKPVNKDTTTFGHIAIKFLSILREFLTKWHPILLHYENQREPHISIKEHEKNWEREQELRDAINNLREDKLKKYADVLAEVSEVVNLH